MFVAKLVQTFLFNFQQAAAEIKKDVTSDEFLQVHGCSFHRISVPPVSSFVKTISLPYKALRRVHYINRE